MLFQMSLFSSSPSPLWGSAGRFSLGAAEALWLCRSACVPGVVSEKLLPPARCLQRISAGAGLALTVFPLHALTAQEGVGWSAASCDGKGFKESGQSLSKLLSQLISSFCVSKICTIRVLHLFSSILPHHHLLSTRLVSKIFGSISESQGVQLYFLKVTNSSRI